MVTEPWLLGIDIGTTAVKAVAFSKKGEVLKLVSKGYSMKHPVEGWSEQDPLQILEAVIYCTEEIHRQSASGQPLFISFSAAMHSIMAVDQKGEALTPCIIWADNRAEGIATRIKSSREDRFFYQRTGVPVHAMSPFCKLLWLKENNRTVFDRAHKFIGIKEFIFYQLFGSWLVDTSIASATGLLNLKNLQWDADILNYIGISPNHLSEVVSPKHIVYLEPEKSPLPFKERLPIVTGASDGALGNLGAFAPAHALVINIGTSSAARIMVKGPVLDEQMQTFCYHVKDADYITGGASNNGGVVLQWLKDQLLQAATDTEQLIDEAMKIKPGPDNPVFLPYILGERAPLWNPGARGMISGLMMHHTRGHLVRATLEGIIFCLYSIGAILQKQSRFTEVYASGGFAKNTSWLQLLADVFNCKVILPSTIEASALGAIALGAEALDISFQPDKGSVKEFAPNKELVPIYQMLYERFSRLSASYR